MRSVLFGVSPADPVALVVTRLLLGATALVACRNPMRQGAGVDRWWRCGRSEGERSGGGSAKRAFDDIDDVR